MAAETLLRQTSSGLTVVNAHGGWVLDKGHKRPQLNFKCGNCKRTHHHHLTITRLTVPGARLASAKCNHCAAVNIFPERNPNTFLSFHNN